MKLLCPELRFLWHHRNNLSADTNGVLWRKRSSAVSQLQLIVPKPGRERLFLNYHATLIGGHLGRNRTLARLSQQFYWSGMADDVGDWLRNCTTCMADITRWVTSPPVTAGIGLLWIFSMFVTPLRIDIDCIYVVSCWPSRDVKVILLQNYLFFMTGTARS